MTSTTVVGVLIRRWYIAASGLLLTLVAAAGVFIFVPPQYTSSSTVVLVRSEVPGIGSNPLLNFDSSLNTTALILVQALNSPSTAAYLGLARGQESYSVKATASVAVRDDGTQRPFISVTAESPNPDRSTAIVATITTLAQQQLSDRQHDLHVMKRNEIELQTVVDATLPLPVRSGQLKAVGIAFVLGAVLTVATACLIDRKVGKAACDACARGDEHGTETCSATVTNTWRSPRGNLPGTLVEAIPVNSVNGASRKHRDERAAIPWER